MGNKDFKFNVKNLIEKFTNGEEVDYTSLNEEVENQVRGFFAKNQPDVEQLKVEARDEAINDFIKEQKINGVENVDQFSAYVKRMNSTSDELKEANQRLETEVNDYKSKYENLESNYNELNSKTTQMERLNKITEKGFNTKYSKAVMSEVESRLNDDTDLETAIDQVKEEYPEWAMETTKDKGNPTPNTEDNPTDAEEMESFRKLVNL